MLVRTVLNEVQNLTYQLIPQQLQQKILARLGGLMGNSSSQMTLIIDENNGLSKNQMFEASEVYLRTKIPPSVVRLKVSKAPREKNFSVTVNKGEKITDAFEDIQVIWQVICTEIQKTSTEYEGGSSNENVERKSIELSFNKEHREKLTSLQSNSDLRSILVSTANRSILVIEDIDCSSDFQNRQAGGYNNVDSQVLTLSGLLNFIDGLWSSCGDERIIIFTTNHKDRLDPALLRPGRMDIHIHMSYCTPSGFKILASNYLGINNHSMFTEIEKLITEVEVTPAEIAEELMKSEVADTALEGLLKYLHTKKMEHGKANVEGEKEARGKEQKSEEVKLGVETRRMKNKRKPRKGRSRK
ncbi:P-loop nucleoside triphosphate hydrolase superfamily protein [Actinidia rufa]|uniref:P-loop nucleoside triphosphate hydrolase superfamily protein n=1 Tax=Actinidia rufa TaxID=165716 RepID=A0A7J0DA47_9ERIC|nr:P-loop nucleoside triphosphate hydrolase superfamily protein [Actinidia rufa]